MAAWYTASWHWSAQLFELRLNVLYTSLNINNHISSLQNSFRGWCTNDFEDCIAGSCLAVSTTVCCVWREMSWVFGSLCLRYLCLCINYGWCPLYYPCNIVKPGVYASSNLMIIWPYGNDILGVGLRCWFLQPSCGNGTKFPSYLVFSDCWSDSDWCFSCNFKSTPIDELSSLFFLSTYLKKNKWNSRKACHLPGVGGWDSCLNCFLILFYCSFLQKYDYFTKQSFLEFKGYFLLSL